jgi:hypothetical protein
MKGDDADKWQEAINAEYNTLLQQGTWELVELPPGEKAIGSGWVFKIKHNALSATKLIWLPRAIHNVLALTTMKSLHPHFALPLCA